MCMSFSKYICTGVNLEPPNEELVSDVQKHRKRGTKPLILMLPCINIIFTLASMPKQTATRTSSTCDRKMGKNISCYANITKHSLHIDTFTMDCMNSGRLSPVTSIVRGKLQCDSHSGDTKCITSRTQGGKSKNA